MSLPGLLQVALYVALLVLVTKPVGLHMARVFSGERTFLSPVLGPVERLIYRLSAVNPEVEQGWKADEVELIDMSPHALQQRMRHGTIYPPDRAERALQSFFREGT